MTADKRPLSDHELDALFDTVQRAAPEPSESLTADVLADAATIAADRPQGLPAAAGASGPGWFASFLNGIGGWQGATAVAASGLFGLWIGYAGQSTLPLVGGLGSRFDQMLSGAMELDPITTFDTFTLDG